MQSKQQKLEVMSEEKEKRFPMARNILFWIRSNLKFLFFPGSRIEELTEREQEYEKTISRRKFMKRMKAPLTILGIGLALFIVTLAVFGPWLAPYTHYQMTNEYFDGVFGPPSPKYPLGQTSLGRDVLSRLIYGARTSLTIALPAIFMSVFFGVIIGLVSGYFGGWIDSVVMRIADMFMAFPYMILAIIIVAMLGREMRFIVLTYGILGVPYYARLMRGSVLQARGLPYVDAGRVVGAGKLKLMFKHVLPNCIQPIIISVTFDIGGVILSFAGLAFLGYSDPFAIEWGQDILVAKTKFIDAPWAVFWPGLMILITVLAFMLIGDGLRDALDPRLRNI